MKNLIKCCLMTILLATRAADAITDCEATITHNGKLCDIKNGVILYNNRIDFCHAKCDPAWLLNYCKIAECDTCSFPVSNCASIINNSENRTQYKLFISSNKIKGSSNKTVCFLSYGESCYRSQSTDSYFLSHYSSTSAFFVSTPCCVLECEDKFEGAKAGSKGYCGSDGQFYQTFSAFCKAFCDNRSLTLNDDATDECLPLQTLQNNCIQNFPNKAVCSNTGVLYDSAQQYCDDLSQNIVQSYITCGDKGCVSCSFITCVNSFEHEDYAYSKVCAPGAILFDSVKSYCLSNPRGNTKDVLKCATGECTSSSCCQANCRSQHEYSVCYTDKPELSTPDEICQNQCDSQSNDYAICTDKHGGQRDCTELDCNIKHCIDDIPDLNTDDLVCKTKKKLSAYQADFCDAMITDPKLGQALRRHSSCSSPEECCIDYCILFFYAFFQSDCKTVLDSYAKRKEFCGDICTATSLPVLMCKHVPCKLETSCLDQCKKSSFLAVCGPSPSFNLISTQNAYCQLKCSDPERYNSIVRCNGNCTPEDCEILSCMHTHSSNHYCGSDGALYTSTEAFCSAKIKNSNIEELDCRYTTACNSREDCCISVCKAENPESAYKPRCSADFTYLSTRDAYCKKLCTSPISFEDVKCGSSSFELCSEQECCTERCITNNTNFSPVCDTGYNKFETVHTFCSAQCARPGLEILMCNNQPCSVDKCCMSECLQEPFNAICTLRPSPSLIDDHYVYCRKKCYDQQFVDSVHKCDGDCSSDDCLELSCLYKEERGYCGTNGAYYTTRKEFCSSIKKTRVLSERLTEEGMPCTNEFECCLANCKVDHPLNDYQPRCSSDFQYLETRDNYCEKFCERPSKYKDLSCDDAPKGICSRSECCVKQCLYSSYAPVCNMSYKLLSKQEYCSSYCKNSKTRYVTCVTGCTQEQCDAHVCKDKPELSECLHAECDDPAHDP